MKKKWLLVFLLIATVTCGLWLYNIFGSGNSNKPAYREHTVSRGLLNVTVLATGIIQPENRLEIKSPVPGRAEKVLVSEGDRVKKGQILAWMSSTERAALLDAATAKGPTERAEWEQMYKPTPILAPIDGMIIYRNIESGQTFTSSDAVLIMSDRLTVKAQVDETDVAKVQLKQSALIVLDAYPDEKILARVDQIAFDAKTVNNVTNYIVDVLPLKTPGFLRSGMTANVTFMISEKADVIYVPIEAIKNIKGSSMVLVKSENPQGGYKNSTPENFRKIKTGISDGKKVEVLEGLVENEIILIAEFKVQGAAGKSSPFSPMGNQKPRGRQ